MAGFEVRLKANAEQVFVTHLRLEGGATPENGPCVLATAWNSLELEGQEMLLSDEVTLGYAEGATGPVTCPETPTSVALLVGLVALTSIPRFGGKRRGPTGRRSTRPGPGPSS